MKNLHDVRMTMTAKPEKNILTIDGAPIRNIVNCSVAKSNDDNPPIVTLSFYANVNEAS